MRSRCGLAAGELRMMRVVARRARLESHFSELCIPVTAGASVHADFPIPECRAVTAPAERRTIRDFQFATIAGLQRQKIGFVVTVEAIVVATVSPVPEDDILMFGRDEDLPFVIVADCGCFAFFMANVAIVVGGVRARGGEEFSGGNARCCSAEKIRVHQGDFGNGRLPSPEIEMKTQGER